MLDKNGRNECAAAQLAFLLHVRRADCHNAVAVQLLAGLVYDRAIRITVKGNAEIKIARADALLQLTEMGGAAVIVDVDAVRLIETDFRLALDQTHQTLHRCGGGTVCAVHRHAQTGQVALDGICKVVGVLDYRVDLAFEYTADLLVGHLRNRLEIVDQVLNPCLGFVRQLVAVTRKNLDAVVLKGVVACRNDNTRICLCA